MPRQLALDLSTAEASTSQWGTFKDSLRAPVHSWFTYPAGFSFKAVEHSLNEANLIKGKSTIYDPFMGCGTTNIVAKSLGFNSVGVEAHPFVIDITKTKMHWKISDARIESFLSNLARLDAKSVSKHQIETSNGSRFPELIRKCFLPESLYVLGTIRDSIETSGLTSPEKRFLRTALICTLRDVSIAATGWPYIAPKKIKVTSMSKDARQTFATRAKKMLADLAEVRAEADTTPTKHKLLLGSSTKTKIDANSVDHIFTSPPYLNNFDYADRTRLEMYFMGAATDWGDISSKVRTKLMTSATTQISRNDPRYDLDRSIEQTSPDAFAFLENAKAQLEALRNTKGGKKSYDLLVSGYFNDIYKILADNFRVLKPGSTARYILGDSAPYGVHIPTDTLIGDIGVGLGFSSYTVEVLRTRGDKWAANPQRHSVPLRETIITLRK